MPVNYPTPLSFNNGHIGEFPEPVPNQPEELRKVRTGRIVVLNVFPVRERE